MAVGDFHVGYEFTVLIGGIAYPFKAVDVEGAAKMVNRANSKYAPGFDIKQSGNKSMTIELEGPYNSAEVPLTLGNAYVLQVTRWAGATAGNGVDQGTFLLAKCAWSGDQESGESSVKCTFESALADFNTLMGA